jgi:flagella basal body P-ring formation protein FlgA
MTIRLAASLALALIAAAPAWGQSLRPAVTVAAPVVRVGDIFGGAGSHADETVVTAPPPGTRITYGADWLAAVAREHQIAWSPGSGYDQVTIERASRVIGSDVVAKQLLAEIAQREPIDNAELELDDPSLRLVVPADADDAVGIDGLAIDHRTGRLSAFISAPAGDPAAVRRRLTARLIYRVDLPVLNHAIAPGATIAAGDLDFVKTRRDRVATDIATEAQQLIGKSPRRPIAQGAPVRLGDLAMPLLVHKNDLVTILLEMPGLQLTAQGKALEDGGDGALVHVANTKSSRIIDAAVVAAGTVRVASPGAAAPPATIAQR